MYEAGELQTKFSCIENAYLIKLNYGHRGVYYGASLAAQW